MCTVPGLSCKTRGISRCVFVGDPRLFSPCVWVSGEVCSGLGVKEFYEINIWQLAFYEEKKEK